MHPGAAPLMPRHGGDDDEPHRTRDAGPGRHCGRPGRFWPRLAFRLTISARWPVQRITPRASSCVARERSAGELADHYVAGSWRGTDAPWLVVAAARSRPGSRATYLVCHKLPAGDGRISGLAGCWDGRLRDWAATCRC